MDPRLGSHGCVQKDREQMLYDVLNQNSHEEGLLDMLTEDVVVREHSCCEEEGEEVGCTIVGEAVVDISEEVAVVECVGEVQMVEIVHSAGVVVDRQIESCCSLE